MRSTAYCPPTMGTVGGVGHHPINFRQAQEKYDHFLRLCDSQYVQKEGPSGAEPNVQKTPLGVAWADTDPEEEFSKWKTQCDAAAPAA